MAKVLKHFRKTLLGKYCFNEYRRIKFKKEFKKYSDYQFIFNTYKKRIGCEVNLQNPTRFTEKLQWLKLFWRDDKATICSDKYTVRGYVEQKGYGYLLNDLIAVYENVNDINVDELPNSFVLKGSHGSGWNLIVKDKSQVNWFMWKKIMRSWLKQNLYYYGREWNYDNQTPRIIVEKYLEDDSGELRDYKFFCFNGKPELYEIDENRFTNHKRIYLDCEGKPLGMVDKGSSHSDDICVNFGAVQKEMLKIAEDLSKDFPHVRVDFYECNGKIYFGELTFFDSSGFGEFSPEKWNVIMGDKIQLPEPNYNLELYKKLHND